MSELGQVERLMAVGILVVILGILAIAVRGVMNDEEVLANEGAPTASSNETLAPKASEYLASKRGRDRAEALPTEGAAGNSGVIVTLGESARPPREEPSTGGPDSLDGTRRNARPAPPAKNDVPRASLADDPIARALTEDAERSRRGGPAKPSDAASGPERSPSVAALDAAGRPSARKLATYTVAEGDSLWRICRKWFGEGDVAAQVTLVQELNPAIDPDRIVVGQVLQMPPGDEIPEGVVSTPPQPTSEVTLYTVLEGDTLARIARRQLGDSNRWAEIYELNRDRVTSPEVIHPGMTLRLP